MHICTRLAGSEEGGGCRTAALPDCALCSAATQLFTPSARIGLGLQQLCGSVRIAAYGLMCGLMCALPSFSAAGSAPLAACSHLQFCAISFVACALWFSGLQGLVAALQQEEGFVISEGAVAGLHLASGRWQRQVAAGLPPVWCAASATCLPVC